MGGWVTLELLAEESYPFAAAVLLAPAAGDLSPVFGGPENFAALQETAEVDGYADFTTIYGQDQQLGKQWFADLAQYDFVADDAAATFTGPSLVIYAEDDEAVSADISKSVAEALQSELVEASGEGHGYGFFSDNDDIREKVAQSTADFFAKALKN